MHKKKLGQMQMTITLGSVFTTHVLCATAFLTAVHARRLTQTSRVEQAMLDSKASLGGAPLRDTTCIDNDPNDAEANLCKTASSIVDGSARACNAKRTRVCITPVQRRQESTQSS